jgi:hypothetical protein
MFDIEHRQRSQPYTRVMSRSEPIIVSYETHSASNHTLTLEVLKV